MEEKRIHGTTASGFDFEFDPLVLDDLCMIELVAEIADPDTDFVRKYRGMAELAVMLLGAEQTERLYEHIKEHNGGRLSLAELETSIACVFNRVKESKNS